VSLFVFFFELFEPAFGTDFGGSTEPVLDHAAFEVVILVLVDTGLQALARFGEFVAVQVLCGDGALGVAFDLAGNTRQRKTSLLV
jgi:hypothetical protein